MQASNDNQTKEHRFLKANMMIEFMINSSDYLYKTMRAA